MSLEKKLLKHLIKEKAYNKEDWLSADWIEWKISIHWVLYDVKTKLEPVYTKLLEKEYLDQKYYDNYNKLVITELWKQYIRDIDKPFYIKYKWLIISVLFSLLCWIIYYLYNIKIDDKYYIVDSIKTRLK